MINNLRNTNAGDLNVSYFEAGSRKGLPVILLHGFPYDIHAYKEVVPLLISSHLKHEILPNIGHNVPQEDPKNFSEAILHTIKIHKNL